MIPSVLVFTRLFASELGTALHDVLSLLYIYNPVEINGISIKDTGQSKLGSS